MSRIRPVALAALAASVVALGACQKHSPTTAADAASHKAAAPAATAVSPPPVSSTARDAQPDVMSEDLATLNRKGYLIDAYFDFDRAELRDDARTELDRDAQFLKKYPSVKVLLEGHCDDRGTEAYNLSLGEERAGKAREYLVSLGVDAQRIQTVSYGKERPFCDADSESCWQENRRDHVVATAK